MKLLLIIGFAALAAVANAFKDPCICTREYMPVCGTDGKTYGNKCMFNCEKATNNNHLEIAHEGACDEHKKEVENTAQKHCACPFLWAPLCGTNERTYPNECVFKCHQDEDKDVKIAHTGVCKGFPQMQEDEQEIEAIMDPCACDRVL
uniref:Secreted multidomain Kazal n=1 Tax=Pristhesancus plagipennis TaxID=1955184 RepID=A0A2K8JLT2_PRIPG|nr:secreted multidomain Kazal precursor [Pristhesancus plagipennis]